MNNPIVLLCEFCQVDGPKLLFATDHATHGEASSILHPAFESPGGFSSGSWIRQCRAACIRSIIVAALTQEELSVPGRGAILFGSPSEGFSLALLFRMHDYRARGGCRQLALIHTHPSLWHLISIFSFIVRVFAQLAQSFIIARSACAPSATSVLLPGAVSKYARVEPPEPLPKLLAIPDMYGGLHVLFCCILTASAKRVLALPPKALRGTAVGGWVDPPPLLRRCIVLSPSSGCRRRVLPLAAPRAGRDGGADTKAGACRACGTEVEKAMRGIETHLLREAQSSTCIGGEDGGPFNSIIELRLALVLLLGERIGCALLKVLLIAICSGFDVAIRSASQSSADSLCRVLSSVLPPAAYTLHLGHERPMRRTVVTGAAYTPASDRGVGAPCVSSLSPTSTWLAGLEHTFVPHNSFWGHSRSGGDAAASSGTDVHLDGRQLRGAVNHQVDDGADGADGCVLMSADPSFEKLVYVELNAVWSELHLQPLLACMTLVVGLHSISRSHFTAGLTSLSVTPAAIPSQCSRQKDGTTHPCSKECPFGWRLHGCVLCRLSCRIESAGGGGVPRNRALRGPASGCVGVPIIVPTFNPGENFDVSEVRWAPPLYVPFEVRRGSGGSTRSLTYTFASEARLHEKERRTLSPPVAFTTTPGGGDKQCASAMMFVPCPSSERRMSCGADSGLKKKVWCRSCLRGLSSSAVSEGGGPPVFVVGIPLPIPLLQQPLSALALDTSAEDAGVTKGPTGLPNGSHVSLNEFEGRMPVTMWLVPAVPPVLLENVSEHPVQQQNRPAGSGSSPFDLRCDAGCDSPPATPSTPWATGGQSHVAVDWFARVLHDSSYCSALTDFSILVSAAEAAPTPSSVAQSFRLPSLSPQYVDTLLSVLSLDTPNAIKEALLHLHRQRTARVAAAVVPVFKSVGITVRSFSNLPCELLHPSLTSVQRQKTRTSNLRTLTSRPQRAPSRNYAAASESLRMISRRCLPLHTARLEESPHHTALRFTPPRGRQPITPYRL